MASEINRMKREQAGLTPVTFDWADLEARTGDKDYVDVIKSTYETEMKIFHESAAATLAEKPIIEKQIAASFRKPGGMVRPQSSHTSVPVSSHPHCNHSLTRRARSRSKQRRIR